MKTIVRIFATLTILGAFLLSGGCAKLPDDGANTKPARLDNLNKVRYIEVFLVGGDAVTGDLRANVYNSSLNTNYNPEVTRDSAPQAWVESLDTEKLKKEFHALGASINGPKLWMLDWFEIPLGKERVFNGVTIPWCATLDLKGVDLKKEQSGEDSYKPTTIARKSRFGYNKGTTVFLIDDTAGNTWIMKGYQVGMKPVYTFEEYAANRDSHFKKLPVGFKLRTKILDKDLILVPATGIAMIMADENFCVYDKTGPGYSNYTP
ncbi:MAG: hypothetical protein AB7U29_14230 [Desulfobulbus sp.]